jgi:outer membrane protein TolC
MRVAIEGVSLATRQLELARVRFEAGSVARLDVLRAEVDLANARARRIQYQAAVDQSYQALRTLLALPQSQPLTLRGTLDDLVVPDSRDALAAALPGRPDLRAFESQRQVASYAVSLANADWKPTVSIIGNVAYQNNDAFRLLRQSNQNYTFGVAMRMPLLAAPGAAARRSAAEAQVRQAEHGLKAALDAGNLELETAWTDLQAASEVVTTQQKALELARESVAIAQTSYENGVITSAELNDAQVALLQTEFQLQQAKFARILAAARARFAAGLS